MLYPTELHCHTCHSDGDFTPKELQKAAKAAKLSLIALTDHNTKSGSREMDDALCPHIRGMEWTTYFGHMLVLGGGDDTEGADWREAKPDNIDDMVAVLHAAGACIGAAHPFQLGTPMCTGGRWQFNVKHWEAFSYMEVFHYGFMPSDENLRAYKLWHSLLDEGYHLAATLGRDWHRSAQSKPPGCTYILSEGDDEGKLTPETALDAIKAGKTEPSVGATMKLNITDGEHNYTIGDDVPAGRYTYTIKCDTNERCEFFNGSDVEYNTLKLITNNDECTQTLPVGGGSGEIDIQSDGWYSFELHGKIDGEDAVLALTSPFYGVPEE